MASDEDTIFALATAPGRAAVAILRISGAAVEAVPGIFGFSMPRPRVATVKKLRDGDVFLDQALVLFFEGPGSYTGENLIELHLHGGKAVYDSVISVLTRDSELRYAEPGEYSRRAFLNGRLNLTEAEAVNDLVNAETEAQRDLAVRQLGGSLSRVFDDWAETLLGVRAHLEAYIDFPDEDLPDAVVSDLTATLAILAASMGRFLNDDRKGERLRAGMRIAVVGPPNVGKSTFVNWLTERDISIVSGHAGTTRDVIEAYLDLAGYPVIVADTAGLRSGGDVVEIEGMKRARNWAERADLRVLVMDGSQAVGIDGVEFDLEPGDLVLFNKMDLVSDCGEVPGYVGDGSQDVFRVSLATEEGLTDVVSRMAEVAREKMDVSGTPVISRVRHRVALFDSVKSVERGLVGLKGGIEPEIIAEELRVASDDLGRISGRVGVEDLLDVVFRDFCIGK